MNIDNPETLEAIIGLSEAVALIAKGGEAFKKKLAELKNGVSDFQEAKATAEAAMEEAGKRSEAARLAEEKLVSSQARAQKVIDTATLIKQEQKVEKDSLLRQSNAVTQAQEELAARESQLNGWAEAKEAEFNARDEALLEAEEKAARVQAALAS